MKNIYSFLFFLLASWQLSSQSFTVELNTDSLLYGNAFKLTFTIENFDGKFEAPDLTNFDIVSGPNMSSSYSIINGKQTSKRQITYYLKPREEGQFYINEAYVIGNDQSLETQVLTLNVYPNPDGIIDNPYPQSQEMFFNFDWPNMDSRKAPLERSKPKPEKKWKRL